MIRIVLLLAGNMCANTAAHVCLKLSAARRGAPVRLPAISGLGAPRRPWLRGARAFIVWQALGNAAAFAGAMAYTALLRGMSLHVAYPLTEGLTAVGVQFLGSTVVLREKISLRAWAGTCLILSGIVLFSL